MQLVVLYIEAIWTILSLFIYLFIYLFIFEEKISRAQKHDRSENQRTKQK